MRVLTRQQGFVLGQSAGQTASLWWTSFVMGTITGNEVGLVLSQSKTYLGVAGMRSPTLLAGFHIHHGYETAKKLT